MIRPAREGDVAALVDVARRAWLSAFGTTAPFPLIQAWVSLDREPGWYAEHWRSMTVAVLEGRIAGVTQPKGDEVNGLWVDPDVQGRGIGSRLLAEAERQIARAGHPVVWLTCSGFNQRAQRFYGRAGYRVTRRQVEPFGGVDEEILRFEKTLPPSGAPPER